MQSPLVTGQSWLPVCGSWASGPRLACCLEVVGSCLCVAQVRQPPPPPMHTCNQPQPRRAAPGLHHGPRCTHPPTCNTFLSRSTSSTPSPATWGPWWPATCRRCSLSPAHGANTNTSSGTGQHQQQHRGGFDSASTPIWLHVMIWLQTIRCAPLAAASSAGPRSGSPQCCGQN